MPTLALYANGLTLGTPGHNDTPPPRGIIRGWSSGAVRRHTRWLYGVQAPELTGTGLAVTLTVRDCPATALEWAAARNAYIARLKRLGLVRLHWVVEWQRRGVPHLHLAVYFPPDLSPVDVAHLRSGVVSSWLAVADRWGAGSSGQYVLAIDGPEGWLQYLSKHAARGVAHYQRQGMPAGWERSGRLWGYWGEWPTGEPQKVSLSRDATWEFRRLVRAWRISSARAALRAASDPDRARAARRRLVSARRMLRVNRRDLSEVRGVSEWAGEGTALQFVALLIERGHRVHFS